MNVLKLYNVKYKRDNLLSNIISNYEEIEKLNYSKQCTSNIFKLIKIKIKLANLKKQQGKYYEEYNNLWM